MFAYPVFASETPVLEDYPSQYLVATNSPVIAQKGVKIECNCIAWAKWYLGRQDESWGYPKDIRVKSEGDVVVTREGEFGHVAVVTKVGSSSLELVEANYKPCAISTRSLGIDDKRIRGYY